MKLFDFLGLVRLTIDWFSLWKCSMQIAQILFSYFVYSPLDFFCLSFFLFEVNRDDSCRDSFLSLPPSLVCFLSFLMNDEIGTRIAWAQYACIFKMCWEWLAKWVFVWEECVYEFFFLYLTPTNPGWSFDAFLWRLVSMWKSVCFVCPNRLIITVCHHHIENNY